MQAGATTPRKGRAPLLVVALVALALAAIAEPTTAHANLLRSEPAANTRVDDPPSRVVLWFSERIEPEHSRVQLFDDADRDRVVAVTLDASGTRVEAEIEGLEEGLYTLRWRALSAVDGHPTRGGFLLGLGVDIPADAEPPAEETVADVRLWETVLRAFAFAGATLAAGLPAYILHRRRVVPYRRWLRAYAPLGPHTRDALLLRVAAGAGAVGALAALLLVAALAARIDGGLVAAIGTTGNGQLLAIRAALLLVAGGVAVLAARSRRLIGLSALAFLAALAALLATSLASHAAAGSRAVLHVAIDFLHQVAAALWIAGVAALVLTLPRVRDPETAGLLVRDFSPFALGAVLVLVATGVASALLHVPDLAMLAAPDSWWLWLLLAKILLLVPLLALGAWNRYGLQSRLLAGRGALAHIRRSAAAEVVLMALVLIATGALTHAAPPAGEAGPTGPLPGQVAEHESPRGDRFVVTIQPEPVRVGIQNVTLRMELAAAGEPENLRAFLTVHAPDGAQVGPLELSRIGEDERWYRREAIFTQDGTWHAIILLQGRDYFEEFDFLVPVVS